jgi:dTMP kinase
MSLFGKALFITLEGGEGAGKSTQARLLADWLTGLGIAVEVTREPGGSPGAEEIRRLLVTGETGRWDPLTETLLHYAARSDHVARRIMPALAAGRWVVCDRFADSTLAYQGYGLGIDISTIARLRKEVLKDFGPDLTLVLDVDAETRRRRTADRPGAEDRYERMSEEFHDRVRAGFVEIAVGEPARCRIIPAAGDIDAVSGRIRSVVRSFIDAAGPLAGT